MGLTVRQDKDYFYVDLVDTVYVGRVVGYTPASQEFYRSYSIAIGSTTTVKIPMQISEGTYCFVFYDANDNVYAGWSSCVAKAIQTPGNNNALYIGASILIIGGAVYLSRQKKRGN